MNPRLSRWWQGLAPRERAMLAVMTVAIAAFGYWYGLLAPLRDWRDRQHAHAEAVERASARVQEDAIAIAARRAQGAAPDAAARHAAVIGTASTAGLAFSRQRVGEDGALTLEFDAVPAPALFAWLDALRTQHGIGPQQLQAQRRNGQVAATVTFAHAAR